MAIGTLGFAFFIGTIVNNVPIFEGREGISLPDNHVLGFGIEDIGFFYVALLALAGTTLFIYALVHSAIGRAFMSLRDSEKAAEASGVNRIFYRTLAFTLSAAVTGVAGVLFAHCVNYVSSVSFRRHLVLGGFPGGDRSRWIGCIAWALRWRIVRRVPANVDRVFRRSTG